MKKFTSGLITSGKHLFLASIHSKKNFIKTI